MGRPPDGPTARGEAVKIRLTRSGLDNIDSRRGQWPRSEYIRQALALAVKHNLRGPTR